jgi:predicted metal-dependent hydrolase
MPQEVLLFNNTPVEIKRRAFKRNIGITMQVNGQIQVSAPKMLPLARIHKFLDQNREWIAKNLESYEELRRRYPPKQFMQGEIFLFLGIPCTLHFSCGVSASSRRKIVVSRVDDELRCEIPPDAWSNFDLSVPHPEVQDAITDFYKTSAEIILRQRIELYSMRMGLKPKALRFRSQKTRWGSCSSRGTLSFNWRLIVAPLVVMDYVIVHELAHLKFYNHSKAFWNLVETQIPTYRERRSWLKFHGYETDFLSRRSELHTI